MSPANAPPPQVDVDRSRAVAFALAGAEGAAVASLGIVAISGTVPGPVESALGSLAPFLSASLAAFVAVFSVVLCLLVGDLRERERHLVEPWPSRASPRPSPGRSALRAKYD